MSGPAGGPAGEQEQGLTRSSWTRGEGFRLTGALVGSLLIHLAVFAGILSFSLEKPAPEPPPVVVDLAMLAPSEPAVTTEVEPVEAETPEPVQPVEEQLLPDSPVEAEAVEAEAVEVEAVEAQAVETEAAEAEQAEEAPEAPPADAMPPPDALAEAAPELPDQAPPAVPETAVPETAVPETAVPETAVSEATVSESAVAETEVAEPEIAEPAPETVVQAEEPSPAVAEAPQVAEPAPAEALEPALPVAPEELAVAEQDGSADGPPPPPAKPLDLPRELAEAPPAAEPPAVAKQRAAVPPAAPPVAPPAAKQRPDSPESLLARLDALKDESLQAEENPELWEVIRAVRRQIARCWTVSAQEASRRFRLDIDVAFDTDGRLLKAFIKQPGRMVADDGFRAFAVAARQALSDCSPFELPAASYDLWQHFTMRFVPSRRASS